MQPGEPLKQAIDTAYRVFAPYPPPSSLVASPLRDANEILKTLTSAPLRDLTGEQIGPYAGWALTTVGSPWDYKHFLPRILEQAVRENVWTGTEPAIIAQKLDMAEWQKWPAPERTAVGDIFSAAWAQARAMHPDAIDASEWLCGVAALGLDVPEALAGWLSPPLPNALLQVASFLMGAPGCIFGGEGIERGYWDCVADAPRRSVAIWLLSDAVIRALVVGADTTRDKDQWLLDQALKVLASAHSQHLH